MKNGLSKRPAVRFSHDVGLYAKNALFSQMFFFAKPPPAVAVVDTGPLSLPLASWMPAIISSDSVAVTPSRAR